MQPLPLFPLLNAIVFVSLLEDRRPFACRSAASLSGQYRAAFAEAGAAMGTRGLQASTQALSLSLSSLPPSPSPTTLHCAAQRLESKWRRTTIFSSTTAAATTTATSALNLPLAGPEEPRRPTRGATSSRRLPRTTPKSRAPARAGLAGGRRSSEGGLATRLQLRCVRKGGGKRWEAQVELQWCTTVGSAMLEAKSTP